MDERGVIKFAHIMAINPHKQAAKKFVEYGTFNRPGSEKSGCQHGVLTSSVHMAWMRTVCGRLEMRCRYSAAIVYNNFPWPDGVPGGHALPSRNVSGASDESELINGQIEKTAQGILDARALYPESSLADLYDPLTMPPELRKAHAANDAAVLKAYGWPTDLSEPEIVSRLFDMYAKLLCAMDNHRTTSGEFAKTNNSQGACPHVLR